MTTINNNFEKIIFDDYDVLLIHEDIFRKNLFVDKFSKEINRIKILASSSNYQNDNDFTDKLSLPTCIKDINKIINDSVIKKDFNKNSSIRIKDYILDKNEKKLIKNNDYLLLTEKEIQLLELFLGCTKSINKNRILEIVWKYSNEADTHTVETHIYRLRKKIKSKFLDDYFILSDKNGYLL